MLVLILTLNQKITAKQMKAFKIPSPLPFVHCFSSPKISLRSFTLDVVTFKANFFSVSETWNKRRS